MNNRLKEFIFNRLYKKLRNVEIIPYNDSIWFIDRENEYWYFEFDKSGTLWWRYHFFTSFFEMFSMKHNEFAPILSSWVEEVLNHKVSTTLFHFSREGRLVEEVLNHKVSTTRGNLASAKEWVEEVLNHKVTTTMAIKSCKENWVEEVLNRKVSTTRFFAHQSHFVVEEVLNHKVTETQTGNAPPLSFVKDVLNYK
jgi:hypothetical protein